MDLEFIRKWMEIWNIEILGFKNSFPFLQTESDKWIACVILRLIRLIIQATVDRKDMWASAILSAAHAAY